jgi:hypothetical protein
VLKAEIQADNGVIYIVDRLLDVPEGTILQILANPQYHTSDFLQALHTSHYDRTLNLTTGEYTGQRIIVGINNDNSYIVIDNINNKTHS